jgi:hypothetical protein
MAESPSERKPSTGWTLGPERVMEGNWEWMRAEGFRPHETLSPEEVEHQRHVPFDSMRTSVLMDQFGLDNVREGDVYDPENDRPLRHTPGMTIYVRDEPPTDPSAQSGKARA